MTASELPHQLAPHLRRLRLSGILDALEVRTQQAIAEHWSYVELLARLVQDEAERREHKRLDLRLRRGAVDTTKTLEPFDVGFNPSINRPQVFDLATCAFVRQRRNVLICGQTGVGKTHLAQAIAHEAARQGFEVLYTTADQLLRHLHAGRADGSTDQRLQRYLPPAPLVIDDFGLKPLPPTGPVDLDDVINGRYEKGSIVATSNRAATEWPELFGDPLLANAGLDRLGHRATVLLFTGRRFRMADRPDPTEVPMPTT
jgi:DNA replication protein DnaC